MPDVMPHFARLAAITTRPPRTLDIQAAVATAFGISLRDLVSPCRAASHARPRHVAMWLVRHTTRQSYPGIARAFGNRHHSSVMHAIERIDAKMEQDDVFAAEMRTLLLALTPGAPA